MNKETLRVLADRFARIVEEDAEELRKTDDEKLLKRLPVESMVMNALANTTNKLEGEASANTHKHMGQIEADLRMFTAKERRALYQANVLPKDSEIFQILKRLCGDNSSEN